MPEELIVDSQDPDGECPGGFGLDDCKAAVRLIKATRNFEPDRNLTAMDDVPHFIHLLGQEKRYTETSRLQIGCLACGYTCTIKLEMLQRQPTDRHQVVYRPT